MKMVRRIGHRLPILFLMVSPLLMGGCQCFYSGEASVRVNRVDPDTDFICWIAETNGKMKVMDYRFGNWPLTGTMSPFKLGGSWNDESEAGTISRIVVWEQGNRIGILSRKESGWQVAWFGGDKAKRHGHIPLLLGGSWTGHLDEADSIESLTDEQMKKLGYDKDDKANRGVDVNEQLLRDSKSIPAWNNRNFPIAPDSIPQNVAFPVAEN